MTLNTKAQAPNEKELKYQQAIQEMESVLDASNRIDNPLAVVKVKTKGASLVWAQSPEKARIIFLNLWNFIDKQTDESFNKEEARTVLLRHLFPKDKKLANQLLKKLADRAEESEVTAFDKINGNDPKTRQLAFLANRLVETDVALAAQVFEQSIYDRTSPITPGLLTRIRAKEPQVANYLASRMMENFNRQPRTLAVVGLTGVANYIFPLAPLPMSSEMSESEEILHSQFMSVGYSILLESLAESDDFLIKNQNFTKENLSFRALSQTFLAATLATLSQHYEPQYFVELTEITNRLLARQIAPIADAVRAQVAAVKAKLGAFDETESLEAKIIAAITKGEFKVAESLIKDLKDENKKKSLTELFLKALSKFHLTNGDVMDALNAARRLENATQRMLLLAEIAKTAHKKRDVVLSTEILSEVRKISAESIPKSIYASTLFAIASEAVYFSVPEANLIIQDAVAVINSIPDTDKEANNKSVSASDSNRFIDSTEMMRAFAALGEKNIDDALLVAAKLKNKFVEMTARLASVEKIIKKGVPKVTKSSQELPYGRKLK